MPLQPPLTQPAYDDLHAIMSHYGAKEPGLGHRIAHRLRDNLHGGTSDGTIHIPFAPNRGCMVCTVTQCRLGLEPDGHVPLAWRDTQEELHSKGIGRESEWFYIRHIRPGMTPANSPAADALDACIEDWLHIQEATLPAHSVKVVAQGWTPRELAALKAEVVP